MSSKPENFSDPDASIPLNGRGGCARVGGTGITGGTGKGDSTRRRSGRLPQESLMSNLGLVLDISIGGMRVLARTPPSGKVKITFREYKLPEPLSGTVAWTKRVGLLMREVGIRFEDVSPELSSMLTRIATAHRHRRVI